MHPDTLRSRVAEHRWFHTIDLGDGMVTPGVDNSSAKLAYMHLPETFDGKSVLDICTFNGYFAFEAERRGAERVVAVDSFVWQSDYWKAGEAFALAKQALASKVEGRDLDVLDVSVAELGTFDVVLLLGVLYHMRHPMLALEKVASVTDELLIVETQVDLLHVRRPVAAFYPGAVLNGDETNWWGPNVACAAAMLREVGFDDVWVPYVTPLRDRTIAGISALCRRRSPVAHITQGRAVLHARRR